MTKYRTIGIFRNLLIFIFVICALVSCNEETVYYSETTDGTDIPVMATVEETEFESDSDSESIVKKRVAITYDDGPHNVKTKRIVDELEKYGFSATFFVLGTRIDGSTYNGTEGLRYAAEKGNEIAIHGYTHEVYFDNCTDEEYENEMKKTESAIKSKLSGTSVRLMRPVGGKITDERIQKSKYSVILWNVDSEDWKYKYTSDDTAESAKEKVDAIVNNVMNNVRDGSIILMHDIYDSTCDATQIILKRLYDEGYEVVSVSELIGRGLSAGKKYYCRIES